MKRVVHSLLALSLTLLVGLPAAAQSEWDQPRFDALIEECEAFMARVDETLAGAEPAMAAVFLDLGWESCHQASSLARLRLGELDEGARSGLIEATMTRELRLAELFVATEGCERAASVLAEALRLSDATPPGFVGRVANVGHEVLRCLPPGGMPEGRTVTLGNEHRDAWRIGELWGFVFESSRFAACPGRFPYPPSFRVEMLEAGHLRGELQAEGVWRMALAQGDVTGCATGGAGLWGTEINVAPGVVDVYIGYSGSRPPANTSFGLALGFWPIGGVATGPSHGVAQLSPEAPRAMLRGYTQGEVDASERFGATCAGVVSLAPNHRLELDTEGSVEIGVTSPMSSELSLIVVPATAPALCAGPGGDVGTTLTAALAAGPYDVFVGEPSSWGTGYEVRFELIGSTQWPPRLASLSLPADGTDHLLEGATPARAVARAREGCPGLFRPAPDVVLDVVEEGQWGIMVESEDDTALALVGADLTQCNGDFAGRNPGLFQHLPRGVYQVFVGVEGSSGGRPFQLRIKRD